MRNAHMSQSITLNAKKGRNAQVTDQPESVAPGRGPNGSSDSEGRAEATNIAMCPRARATWRSCWHIGGQRLGPDQLAVNYFPYRGICC